MEENQARQRAAQDRLGLLLRNKKGSSMVEATIVFPLVILVVMAVILILAFLYNEVATSTKSHLALTEAMGRETETVWVYKNVPENIAVTQGRHLLKPCFFSKEGVDFQKRGLLENSFTKVLEYRVYGIKEKKVIRYADFLE